MDLAASYHRPDNAQADNLSDIEGARPNISVMFFSYCSFFSMHICIYTYELEPKQLDVRILAAQPS